MKQTRINRSPSTLEAGMMMMAMVIRQQRECPLCSVVFF
jgi:hypothetical protein